MGKWGKLCVPKAFGGYEFRRFKELNMAFIGKIAWRLISFSESLDARVLKSKYYPNSDFFSARLGHCPSYTWRGIIKVQDLIKRGCRWRVGNGVSIKVGKDAWLEDCNNP